MKRYLIAVEREFVRDTQVAVSSEVNHDSDDWDDISGSLILGFYVEETEEKAIEKAASQHGLSVKALYAISIDSQVVNLQTVSTPKGTISVEEVQGEYPGFYVMVNGIALVLVEYDATEEEHAVRVWSYDDPHNDYSYKQSIPDDFGINQEGN